MFTSFVLQHSDFRVSFVTLDSVSPSGFLVVVGTIRLYA